MQRRPARRALLAVATAVAGTLAVPATADAAVACGQAITRNTTLDHDLTCSGPGIFINASNVTLNLGGYTITGPVPDDAQFRNGITIGSNRSGVTVTNGTVRGFERGITINPGANDARLAGLALDANGLGLAAFTNTITGVVPERARIAGNTISNTTRFAAMQLGGNNHRIEGNTVTNASSTGIRFFGHSNTLSMNRITDAGASAIAIGTTPNNSGPFSDNQILNNTITGSGRLFNSSSVSVQAGSNTKVQGNRITGRLAVNTPGIFVENSTNTLLSANRVEGAGTGVLLRGASSGDTVIEKNVVSGNRTGIQVSPFNGSPIRTLIAGNIADGNSFDGIAVFTPDSTVSGNTAVRNGQWGIFAASGVTDGGGNRASRNGVAAQCTSNIAC